MSSRPRVALTWAPLDESAVLTKLALYVDMLAAAGAEPVVLIPAQGLFCARSTLASLDRPPFPLESGDDARPQDFDGLVIAGGPDVDPALYGQAPCTPTLQIDPRRDAFELPLARAAVAQGLPVLGICRGLQVLNVALGGSLFQDIPTQLPGALEHSKGAYHGVDLLPESRIAQLAGVVHLTVNSYHHQGVELPGGLAAGLRATAHTADGVVEAVEPVPGHAPGYLMAVQWHPEKLAPADPPAFSELSRRLFADFVEACQSPAATGAATQSS